MIDILKEPLFQLFIKCITERRFPNVLKRIDKHLEDEHILDPMQYGFRRGTSTVDATTDTTSYTRNSDTKYNMAVFVDISGAFDLLWWPQLIEVMEKYRLPYHHLIEIIRGYCRQRKATIYTETGAITTWLQRGCPQGSSILGPVLWIIYMDSLLKELRDHTNNYIGTAYAYDLVVITGANSRLQLVLKGNNNLMELLNNWCHSHKMSISYTNSGIRERTET